MRPVKPSTETETKTFIEIETQIERKKWRTSTFTNGLLTEMSTCLYFTLSFLVHPVSRSLSLRAWTISQLSHSRSHDRSCFNKSLRENWTKKTNEPKNRETEKRSCKNVETNSSFSCLCFCVSGPGLPTDVFHMRHAIHCSSCQFIATF